MNPTPGSASAEELLAQAGFLRRLAGELVRDPQDAADLVQETYLAALEHPPERPGPIRGWLATVASNLARNARRGARRRATREELVARPERVAGIDVPLETLEIQRALFELVLGLASAQRTVLYLRYYEGLTPTAIAARLDVPVKTVKTRHTRALAELRERLDARSNGDRTRWTSALLPLSIPRGAGVTGGALTAVLGGLAVKKAVVVAALVLLALGSWWGWQRSPLAERFAASRGRHYLNPAALEEKPLARAPALAPEVLAQRVPLGEPVVATTGALEVHLAWHGGAPAGSVGIDVTCENDPAPREEYFRGVTDDSGVARFDGLFAGPARVWPDLRLRPEGYAWFGAEVEAGVTRMVTLTLAEGLDVEGKVVDPAGRPVAGAEIWGGFDHRCRRVATCAADGTFRLFQVDGHDPMGARAVGFGPSLCFRGRDLPVALSGARLALLELGASAGRVTGRVLDPDGKPVAGAHVRAGPRGGHNVDLPSGLRGTAAEPARVETTTDGLFALANDLEAGRQPVHATARGFPVWQGEVEVVAGQESFVEIRLERPARVEGRVVGVEGQPVAGVIVLASEEERGGWYRDPFPPSKDVTDEQGWFALDWVAPGMRELNAHDRERPGIGRARASVACVAGETTTCELRLDLGLTIAGRLVDGDGLPLANWRVDGESALMVWPGDAGQSSVGQWYPRSCRTDEQGRFSLANVGNSPHDLTVSAPDEIPIPPRAERKNVPPGTQDLLLVVKNAGTAKGTYRGVFLGSDGRPPQEVELVFYPENGSSGLFVDFDPITGAFEDQALPGRYRLHALHGGQTLAVSDLFTIEEGGDTDIGTLLVGDLGAIELTVRGLSAKDLARLEPALDREGHSTTRLEFEDGVFRAHGLDPGRWTLTTHSKQWYLAGAIEIASGGTTALVLDAQPTVSLALDIHAEEPGILLGKVTIEARRPDGTLLYRDGRQSVQPRENVQWSVFLPAGPVVIEAWEGERRGRGEATLGGAGAALEITLR